MSTVTFNKKSSQETLQHFLMPAPGKPEGSFAERVHAIPGITKGLVNTKSQAGLTRFINESLAEYDAVSKAEQEARRILAVLQTGSSINKTEETDHSKTDICILKEQELTEQLTTIQNLMQEMKTNLQSTLYELKKMEGTAGYFSWMSANFFDPALREYRKKLPKEAVDESSQSQKTPTLSSPSHKTPTPRSTLTPPSSPVSNSDPSGSSHGGICVHRVEYNASDLITYAGGCSRTPLQEEDDSHVLKATSSNASEIANDAGSHFTTTSKKIDESEAAAVLTTDSSNTPDVATGSQSGDDQGVEELSIVKVEGDSEQVITLAAFIDTPRPASTTEPASKQGPLGGATTPLERNLSTAHPPRVTIRRRAHIPPPPTGTPPTGAESTEKKG